MYGVQSKLVSFPITLLNSTD